MLRRFAACAPRTARPASRPATRSHRSAATWPAGCEPCGVVHHLAARRVGEGQYKLVVALRTTLVDVASGDASVGPNQPSLTRPRGDPTASALLLVILMARSH